MHKYALCCKNRKIQRHFACVVFYPLPRVSSWPHWSAFRLRFPQSDFPGNPTPPSWDEKKQLCIPLLLPRYKWTRLHNGCSWQAYTPSPTRCCLSTQGHLLRCSPDIRAALCYFPHSVLCKHPQSPWRWKILHVMTLLSSIILLLWCMDSVVATCAGTQVQSCPPEAPGYLCDLVPGSPTRVSLCNAGGSHPTSGPSVLESPSSGGWWGWHQASSCPQTSSHKAYGTSWEQCVSVTKVKVQPDPGCARV